MDRILPGVHYRNRISYGGHITACIPFMGCLISYYVEQGTYGTPRRKPFHTPYRSSTDGSYRYFLVDDLDFTRHIYSQSCMIYSSSCCRVGDACNLHGASLLHKISPVGYLLRWLCAPTRSGGWGTIPVDGLSVDDMEIDKSYSVRGVNPFICGSFRGHPHGLHHETP